MHLEDFNPILRENPHHLPGYVAAIYIALRNYADQESAEQIYHAGLETLDPSRAHALTRLYKNLSQHVSD